MTLRPSDMLEIQSAIDQYERKFPRRPEPSAEVALAWKLGKREAARLTAGARDTEPESPVAEKHRPEFAQQECNRLVWAWEQLRLQWNFSYWPRFGTSPSAAGSTSTQPWVKGALRLGWWGMVALVTASVFFFGAIVGGLK
jgi:hypothetical protein